MYSKMTIQKIDNFMRYEHLMLVSDTITLGKTGHTLNFGILIKVNIYFW